MYNIIIYTILNTEYNNIVSIINKEAKYLISTLSISVFQL